MDAINVVRLQETGLQIDLLGRSLDSWLRRQEMKDSRKQYGTLLTTLRVQLGGLIDRVREAFGEIHPSASRGAVYAGCRLQEKRLLWIERLWGYFRDKVDQRDLAEYRDVLAAADEVVWSCYAEPFRVTGRPHGAPPLPFIAAEYSPKAIPRHDVPQELSSDVDSDFLSEMLRELPVSIVSLPPQCLRGPWWLVYLAHEVGHHVQFDLLPEEALVEDFRQMVKDSIADEELAEKWQYRGEEIFADAFSLHMVGPWALWALTELEWTDDAGMLNDDDVRYPAPVYRLLFMNQLLHRIGFTDDLALRGFAGPNTMRDMEVVTALAGRITREPVADGRTFSTLCGWNASDHQGTNASVTEWKADFTGGNKRDPDETLAAARLALAAGVAAWAEASAETDANRREGKRKLLAAKLIRALCDSHEPVERAAEQQPVVATTESKNLRSLLFESNPARLGAW